MRTIEEIQKDINNAEEEGRKWYKKRDEYYEELKKAQKTDVVNYKGKYIRLGWDYAVMYVTDQTVSRYEVKLEGVRIYEKDYLDHDKDDGTWTGDFSIGVSLEPLRFHLEKFKDLTIGPWVNMYEITKEQFDEYVHEMLEEYKEKLNFEDWI